MSSVARAAALLVAAASGAAAVEYAKLPSDVVESWASYDESVSLLQLPRVQTQRREVNLNPREAQSVHWIFTTDCSAYMYNQGNLMLGSAEAVGQRGNFTWIVTGCTRQEQFDEFRFLAHPRARAFFMNESGLVHPDTGARYQDFQASNRPISVRKWFEATNPQEDAIAIIDPDEMWQRPVLLVEEPNRESTGSAWETNAVKPGMGTAARYGIGCVLRRFDAQKVARVCRPSVENCTEALRSGCESNYASGPPWILHREDAGKLFKLWTDSAIRVHEAWPDMLAEQASYGIAQAMLGIKNRLDAFWFLSSADDTSQPWTAAIRAEWDPCKERKPPPQGLGYPPLWHACSTFHIPGEDLPKNMSCCGDHFRLHKDHIHKDLLDCGAPLLQYAPADALEQAKANKWSGGTKGIRETWSVCEYTNLVNFHAASFKRRHCKEPNLNATFAYPGHSQSFLNKDSRLARIFRKGGWSDIDYTIGRV